MLKLLGMQTYVMTAAVALACCLAIGAKPPMNPSLDPAQAAAVEAKNKAEAEKQSQEARRQSEAAKKVERQMAQLTEAERTSSDGLYKEANANIAAVLGEADDGEVIKRAKAILENNRPTLRDKLGLSAKTLFIFAAWWVDFMVGVLALIALYLFLRLVRSLWSWAHRGKWRVDSIKDSSGYFLADAIVESLGYFSSMKKWNREVPPETSGLLKLERLQLPSPEIDLTPEPLDLSAALSTLNVQIGGISLSGIAGAGRGIKGWFNATRPTISGAAILCGSELRVRLDSLGPDRRANTVNASVAGAVGAVTVSALGPTPPAFSAENIRSVAAAASYQIFYLISKKGSTPIEAKAANKLREGLNLLGQSIYDHKPKQLGEAYEAFRLARTECPDLFEAYLYEGITLDLLQQHDEAVARFKYLEDEQRIKSVSLREKAAYNRAISLFRKYKYREAQEADKVLADLRTCSEIKSMARAARASVISHYPMYWRERPSISGQPLDENNVREAKKALEPDILKLISEVTIDKEHLERELEKPKAGQSTGKGKDHRRNESEDLQLEWAIKNAWGALHLNCAMYFYAEPYAYEADKPKHQEYLLIAYDAFQACAMLITPGIEILTNLAKVCLELDRIQQGCSYLEQAIKLNPCYEYAYYRLASVREERKEMSQLLSVLKRCEQNLTPAIAGFIELFRKYDTQLHPPVPKPKETPADSKT